MPEGPERDGESKDQDGASRSRGRDGNGGHRAPARPEPARRVVEIPGTAPRRAERPLGADDEQRKLVVGRDISLNGEITSCEKLVVQGTVEAQLTGSRKIEIAETGLFKGLAEIDTAEISGRFEGELTVHDRLIIRATGRVSGTVRYGRIQIEEGGEISGDVEAGTPEGRPTVKAVQSLSDATADIIGEV